jgi:DNA mismatch repair ATPase MutS
MTNKKDTSLVEKLEIVYKERIKKSNLLIKKLKKWDLLFIIVKLLLFISGVFLFFKFFPGKLNLSFLYSGVFFAAFVVSVLFHEIILKKINYFHTLIRINENEIKMPEQQFLPEIDNGEDFIDPGHYYTSDLDVFGERSLFHTINRTVTGIGRERLAQSLRTPCKVKAIEERQEAVKELKDMLDFRQNIQAHGMTPAGDTLYTAGSDDATGYSIFLGGKKSKEFFLLGKKSAVCLIYLIPLVTISLFISMFFGMPLGIPLLSMIFQLLINWVFAKRVSRIYELTTKNGKILKTYAGIIKEIEDETFASTKLKSLKRDLSITGAVKSGKVKASQAIKKLSNLLEWFDLRLSGMIHFILNNSLLWDLHSVLLIEKWQKKFAAGIGRWFEVIGEVEVLSTFANLYFNNPDWTLAGIKTEGFRLQAENLGHPLIPRKERVCNDIDLDRAGSILIVTGPNMGGKSTFLRTLGVNSVLALAGAPVCATHIEISPFKLITSMQSTDSLDKHLSLFYSELQRLKLIIDNINLSQGPGRKMESSPVFFLIDEMLKGTNAVDRQKGSIALLKQLIGKSANGTAATHDLKLTHLEKLGNGVRNYHFDGEVKGDKLIFDFKLRKGVCQSANALLLMERVGIKV